jgi:chemotaxis protein methyltransferase WspC
MTRFAEIEAIITECIGLDTESIGTRAFDRAVELCLGRDPNAYAEFIGGLRAGGSQLDDLIDRLVIPETWFFRDQQAFELLRQRVLDGWIARLGGPPLRILSAPCSTGEEAYSVAISLLDAGLTAPRFRLEALDISRKALATAREARYGRRAFRRLSERYAPFFRQEGDDFRVRPEVAESVTFLHGNLLAPAAPGAGAPYHVVFCKNLTIYLTSAARDALVANLKRMLHPEGLLFVGHSEVPLFLRSGFVPVPFARSFALCRQGLAEAPVRQQARRARLGSRPRSGRAPVTGRAEAPRAAQASPEPAEPSIEAARRLADRGELGEAARLCSSLMKPNCLDPNVYYLAGLIEQASNRLDAAEDLLAKAVYLDPKHYESLVQLALLSEQKGQGRKAAQYRERLRRLQLKTSTK